MMDIIIIKLYKEVYMHHKRGRTKNRRAGCLMCKPNKMNGWRKDQLGHRGFSKIKKEIAAKEDLRSEIE